jgi:hypothetical protein
VHIDHRFRGYETVFSRDDFWVHFSMGLFFQGTAGGSSHEFSVSGERFTPVKFVNGDLMVI